MQKFALVTGFIVCLKKIKVKHYCLRLPTDKPKNWEVNILELYSRFTLGYLRPKLLKAVHTGQSIGEIKMVLCMRHNVGPSLKLGYI